MGGAAPEAAVALLGQMEARTGTQERPAVSHRSRFSAPGAIGWSLITASQPDAASGITCLFCTRYDVGRFGEHIGTREIIPSGAARRESTSTAVHKTAFQQEGSQSA